jgi:predicted RNA-binding protein associated with RNAse of E/G family
MSATPLRRPLRADDETILQNGSPVVWFTFPNTWHDIGRFHTVDGRFTGAYANVLTPVEMLDETAWSTTDLFLDVWLPASGEVQLLDEDELIHAEAQNWIQPELARQARAEASRLIDLAARGEWPPPIVRHWTLERVTRELASR